MPDVITGLALLLLFVAMQSLIGWPAGRGMLTIIIAHATFCMAYVTVVVQSRLADLDLSLEEAAMDLGATPVRVFFDITLPIIAPALISGWLLAFTLSLDDLVIASFVSGPGSSTLPMVIFSKVRLGVSPDVNALATIIIGVVALGVDRRDDPSVAPPSRRGADDDTRRRRLRPRIRLGVTMVRPLWVRILVTVFVAGWVAWEWLINKDQFWGS